MSFRDLRAFLSFLDGRGELKRIRQEIDPALEITEVCRRVLREGGPALLFERPRGSRVPLLANLFGTPQRVAFALQRSGTGDLAALGAELARLHQPAWPERPGGLLAQAPAFARALDMPPRTRRDGPCQAHVITGEDIDLGALLPLQTCWPDDAGPLITWGLVISRADDGSRHNVGVYRQQVIGPRRLILRWLPQRGGARDYAEWTAARPGRPFPVAVAIGADPALLVAAAMPVPDSLGEYLFAGLLRGARTELVRCRSHDLLVPATAEWILEGHVLPGDNAREGPFGDHTGYYDSTGVFPVMTVNCVTHRSDPLYQGTYTGRPPWDEPSMLAVASNELFVPILKRAFPEVVDFYLPPEACSYRVAVVSMRKRYPGHPRELMLGLWSYLHQFSYTKLMIVTDEDIDVRDWSAVLWALATRTDPARDTLLLERMPIDYLDFASPVAGLGSKLGFDATRKGPGETDRAWGRPIEMSPEIVSRIDALWDEIWR
ncbi:MAG: UbiD family decarboxylase [Gammaproteobacteria bacterium]|nr:UbiD family decarboxylase [Gammaproteobacteria bacterium]